MVMLSKSPNISNPNGFFTPPALLSQSNDNFYCIPFILFFAIKGQSHQGETKRFSPSHFLKIKTEKEKNFNLRKDFINFARPKEAKKVKKKK